MLKKAENAIVQASQRNTSKNEAELVTMANCDSVNVFIWILVAVFLSIERD